MPRVGANGTKGNRKYHNITVDADVHAVLLVEQDRLTEYFGFKPSLSQMMRHLLIKHGSTRP